MVSVLDSGSGCHNIIMIMIIKQRKYQIVPRVKFNQNNIYRKIIRLQLKPV